MNRSQWIFISLLLAAALTSFAQEASDSYRPFVEEGKEWVSDTYTLSVRTKKVDYIQGDTIVNGILCKVWHQRYPEKENMGEFLLPVYEVNKQVWFFQNGDSEPRLAYDFGAEVGDTLVLYSPNAEIYQRLRQMHRLDIYEISWKDTVVVTDYCFIAGLRCQKIRPGRQKMKDNSGIQSTYFIEGIGSIDGPTQNFAYGPLAIFTKLLQLCTIDNQTLYQRDDFFPSSISKPKFSSSSSSLFDLSGRRLSAPPAKGVYIENGQKRVARGKE